MLGYRGRGGLHGDGLDIAFFVGPDGVLHLDLFFAALLLIKLGSESTEVLRILGDMVLLSGGALADASVMVESAIESISR